MDHMAEVGLKRGDLVAGVGGREATAHIEHADGDAGLAATVPEIDIALPKAPGERHCEPT